MVVSLIQKIRVRNHHLILGQGVEFIFTTLSRKRRWATGNKFHGYFLPHPTLFDYIRKNAESEIFTVNIELFC